eukprot:m.302929 g.302929  ORF g.302929 m.302929 type:complete len:312 (-) comp15890_c0_seq19:1608-2543(-)
MLMFVLILMVNVKAEFAQAFDEAQSIVFHRMMDPFWILKSFAKPLFKSERRLKKCVTIMDKLAYSLIEEKRSKIVLDARKDLLSRFMTLRDEHGNPLSNELLRDIIMSFIIAGRDTTAILLSWTIWELHKNPEALAILVKEIDEQLQGNSPDYDVLQNKMPYLSAVLKETLRLNPSAPRGVKCALNDDVLPDGTTVPAGATVLYVPWVMGRLNSLWPNATAFQPERWLKMEQEPSPYHFLVFNAGARSCLGRHMAMLEARVMLVTLLQQYRVVVTPGQTVDYAVTLTLPLRNGLRVVLERRTTTLGRFISQ